MRPGPAIARGLAPALLLTLATAAPAAEGVWELSGRADVRGRSGFTPGSGAWASEDVELQPTALGTLRGPQWFFSAQYDPRLLLTEPHAGGSVTSLHRGRLLLTWRGERTGLRLLQEGAYGTLDVGPLRVLDGALPSDVAAVQTLGLVPYQRSGTWLSLDYAPIDRVGLSISGAWVVSGSPTLSYALPLQRGPLGSAQWRWSVNRVDTFTTTARAMAAWFATGQQQLITSLSETWERRFTQTVTGYAGGGVAYTREFIPVLPIVDAPIPGQYAEVLPVATLGVRWQQPVRGAVARLDGRVRMEPYADRFTGFVYERLEARVETEWKPLRDLTIEANGGFAWAVPIGVALQADDRIVFTEGTATWQAQEWVALAFAARVLWVQQPRISPLGQFQALGVISAVIQDRHTGDW